MSGKGSIKKMLNNSGLILRDRTGRHGFKSYRYVCDDNGNIRPLVPRLPSEHPDQFRIWCLHGCCVGHRVGLFFVKVKMLDSGPFPVNFEVVGSGLAMGDKEQLQFKRIPYNGSDLFWRKNEPHFGSAVLVDPDQEWIYVYGVSQDATNVQRCYLARVRPTEIEDKRRYTYFASAQLRWSPLTDRAISILYGMPNEMSVSHNQHLNCYLAVHSLDLTGRIVGRTAPEPWGPWSEPVTLYTVSVRRQKPLPYPPLIYAGKEHPELCEKRGSTIYVTYIEFEEYFPHLIEIRLE